MSSASGYHYFSTAAASSTDRRTWLLTPQPPSKSIVSKINTASTTRNCVPSQLRSSTFYMPFSPLLVTSSRRARLVSSTAAAAARNNIDPKEAEKKEEEVEEVEEDLPWIQDKALDIVEFSGSVTQALPGPRVGQSSVPWILAIPLAYVGISFVFAVVKTVRKFTSPKEVRRKLVNKNAELCRSIDELLEKEGNGVQEEALNGLMQKTGFSMVEILRKYIRYALNEKPFNPKLVATLIQLRKTTLLDDSQVAEILNDISKRIVKDKGPVVMNVSGYSEKGLRRKLAVQALFGKIFYLSELPEFCGRDSSLIVKEIFGVVDEDAEKLRLHTVAEAGDMDSLEKMVGDSDSDLDSEDSGEGSASALGDP
ncbi:uncharacterized protein LOC112527347 [Cynara cardunculus var. scolymus]|uniref:Armadillo-like repeats domain-containing protein n=1 Tax=Cynara cardunculus var. scolymus TaxID=59895 RepID=A0A124SD46_CYNCS|nr:uncharacterized protein LOC112527347 [Cynara cardunculus var. scolymus]KVH95797.1 hypothetical protein Ccrd_002114 [Cynara cardunculus var. scolymus]